MSLTDLFKKNSKPTNGDNIIEDYELGDIIYRKVTEDLWLCPYDAERFYKLGEVDAQLLSMGIDDADTKKYLPGLAITEDNLKKRVLSVELGLEITYLITLHKYPVGMIILNPPKYNKVQYNLPIWTIDYFVVNNMRNKGIMSACFPPLLKLLAENIGIKDVYAWVHDDNEQSIRLLEKFFFRLVDSVPLYDNTMRPIIREHYLALKCPVQELRFYDTHLNCPAYWADRPTMIY